MGTAGLTSIAARAAGVPEAKITSTLRRTRTVAPEAEVVLKKIPIVGILFDCLGWKGNAKRK
jgi:hypothetical protein